MRRPINYVYTKCDRCHRINNTPPVYYWCEAFELAACPCCKSNQSQQHILVDVHNIAIHEFTSTQEFNRAKISAAFAMRHMSKNELQQFYEHIVDNYNSFYDTANRIEPSWMEIHDETAG